MRKQAVVMVLLFILAAALTGCGDTRLDNYDIAGTWYGASDDDNSVVFDINGTVILQGYNMGAGLYAFDSGEMEGVIFSTGVVPRILRIYLYLDDTLAIGDKVYVRN